MSFPSPRAKQNNCTRRYSGRFIFATNAREFCVIEARGVEYSVNMDLNSIKEESEDYATDLDLNSEHLALEYHRTIFQPFVYGNTARQLEKPNSENHTHEWTLYLKPYFQHCDMTKFVRKVVFVLEPHYRNVTLTKMPYVVTRSGWGEFTAQIKIYMTFSSRAQILTHWLRLVEYTDRNDETSPYSYVPFVRYEDYNEIVIVDPTEEQQRALQTGTTEPEPEFEQFNLIREQTIKKLLEARKVVQAKIEEIKHQIQV